MDDRSGVSKAGSDEQHPDPERLLDRLIEEHRSLSRVFGNEAFELFHRSSVGLRVGRSGPGEPVLRSIGREDGVAIRIAGPDGGGERFAAASGCGGASLRWAIDHARPMAHRSVGGGAPWANNGTRRADRDEVDRLPSPAELKSWLARSWDLLQAQPVVGGRVEPLEAWVETAATVECLVGPGGLATVRTRTRAWAMARVGALDPVLPAPRPLFVASRRWDRLDATGWAGLAADRRWGSGALAGSHAGRMPVTFTAESASALVAALVRALHTGSREPGVPVGPGWRVVDDPLAPDSLFGGTFDDAGFPTRRRTLADGERGTGAVAGPGFLRRPSFRDPPQALPFHPVLDAGPEDSGDDRLLVSELAIHPLPDGRWLLECDGILRRGSEWGPLVRSGLISTAPAALVRSCTGRMGPSRPSHRGVHTPALLFDGLEVRF